MSLGFSDGLVLGLRLGSRDAFGLSDTLKLGLRVCPGLQLGADVLRDVVERQNCAALDVTYVRRDTYYSPSPFKFVPSWFLELKMLTTKNCDLLLIKTIKRPTDW